MLQANVIGLQNGNDPDSNGNGIGIDVGGGSPIYQTGIAMDAIASTNMPYGIARTGPAGVRGRYFRDILIDMADMYCWGQTDSGSQRGFALPLPQ